VLEAIRATKISSIHPPRDENTFLQELVAQFLTHDGYVETAQSFALEVKQEAMALQNNESTLLQDFDVEEDINAINRQSKSPLPLTGEILGMLN
jgi:hypothetical protein